MSNRQLTPMPVPQSIPALETRIKQVQDVNNTFDDKMSGLERVAVFITDRVGTMGFFLVILIWTTLWLGWNFLAPKNLQFDPPMAFVFWLFLSNLIQIHLMPLILVAQNLQSRHAELRADNDYHVNLRNEQQIDVLLKHLEFQNAMLLALSRKAGLTDEELTQAWHDQLADAGGGE